MSGEMMTFPSKWEQFLHDYEFEDARRVYTNGSRLIPSFRVKQMMEHYAPSVEQTRMVWCCSLVRRGRDRRRRAERCYAHRSAGREVAGKERALVQGNAH